MKFFEIFFLFLLQFHSILCEGQDGAGDTTHLTVQNYALCDLVGKYSTVLTSISWDCAQVSMACSSWSGVACDGAKNIIHLELPNLNLQGKLEPTFFYFSELTYLKLSGNSLTGRIPTEISMVPRLSWLDLSDNSLGLGIPNQLGTLISLQTLLLHKNGFTGPMPDFSFLLMLTRL